jgi:hypothetical protein
MAVEHSSSHAGNGFAESVPQHLLIGEDSAMKFRHVSSYDATVADVYAMLMDPAFRDRIGAANDVVSSTVKIDGDDVVVDMMQRTKGVPSFAKRFMAETTHAIVREHWTDGTKAALEIETPKAPTAIKGSVTLAESDGRTTQTYELEVKASVPLIGGKIEKVAADLTVEGFKIDERVGREWLAGNRS